MWSAIARAAMVAINVLMGYQMLWGDNQETKKYDKKNKFASEKFNSYNDILNQMKAAHSHYTGSLSNNRDAQDRLLEKTLNKASSDSKLSKEEEGQLDTLSNENNLKPNNNESGVK